MLRNKSIRKPTRLAASGSSCFARALSPPPRQFKLGAISDGFSQDFEQALKIMKSYGLAWVEFEESLAFTITEVVRQPS